MYIYIHTLYSVSCARRFAEAIAAGRISKVEQIDDCCVLAAVGQRMASRKGVAATMFGALAKANINIRCVLWVPGLEAHTRAEQGRSWLRMIGWYQAR